MKSDEGRKKKRGLKKDKRMEGKEEKLSPTG